MNGLQRLRARLAEQGTPAPIESLIGFYLEHVEEGIAVFGLDAGPQHANPMGTLHGGVLCDVGDAAMGAATITTLDEDETFTTLELKINFFKPVRSGRLVATGTVVRRTRQLAYVECEIKDEVGSLVAKLASSCMILRGDSARGR